MGSYKDQFTRPLHNEGVELTLYTPDWEDTGEWLRVLGVDSDAFEAAQAKEHARRLADSDKDAKHKSESETDRQRRMVASLVVGWSFEEEFSQEAVIELFRNAPHLMDQVTAAASRTGYWIQKKRENSSKQPLPDSSSSE